MHAVKQLTPQIILIMCVGIVAFMVIMRLIFKKKR
jgi:hypothetical protein